MNETPIYNLTGLTDEQWAAQLASQEKMKVAELESQRSVDLERLRNERETARGRRDLIKKILGGLAVLLIALTFLIGGIYAIDQDVKDSQEKAITCIQSGGEWVEASRGGGDRCERP